MKVIEDFIPLLNKNRSGIHMTPTGITVHSTANPGVGAWNHSEYLKHNPKAIDGPKSWHFTVDDIEVYQHLPLTEMGWHAGDGWGPGNSETIGVEICEFNDPLRQELAIDKAVDLLRFILESKPFKGLKIYQHHDWDKTQNCPRILRDRPASWEAFVSSVREPSLKEEHFKDVPVNHMHYPDILWAVDKGLMVGYSKNLFGPEEPLTRGQMATILRKIHRG